MNRSHEIPPTSSTSGGWIPITAPTGVVIALLWLIAYLVFFFSFDLPNSNPKMARGTLLSYTPLLLIMNLEAETEQGEAPASWSHFPERFDLLLVAGFIAAAAWGGGGLILRLIGLSRCLDRLERLVCAVGLGLAWLSLLTLACGLVGMLQRPLLLTLLAVPLLVESVWMWRYAKHDDAISAERAFETPPQQPVEADARSKSSRAGKGGSSRRPSTTRTTTISDGGDSKTRDQREQGDVPPWVKGLCLAIMLPFFLAMLFGSLLPPTDFDTKAYHLVGPKEWYQQGSITFLPHNVYTSFPFLTEMLCLLGMVLRGDWYRGTLAGQGVLMLYGPLTALGLLAAGRRWFSPLAGWMAATIHLSTPWIYRISIIPYAEGGLTFYLFAALWGTMRGIEALRAPPLSKPVAAQNYPQARMCGDSAVVLRLFLLAGLFAGSGMACKYPGIVQVVIPLGAAVLFAALRTGRGDAAAAGVALWFVGRFWRGNRPVKSAEFAVERTNGSGGGESETATTAHTVEVGSSRKSFESSRWQRRLICATAYALGVAIAIGPWLIKNVVETGNPVYPLMYTLFGGRDLTPALNAKWRAGHSPPHHRLGDLAEKFIDVTAKSDWLSPLLFGLCPLALLRRPRGPARELMYFLGYLFLVWWLLTHRIDRFWVPLIPVVSLLAGAGFDWSRSLAWRVGAGLLAGLCITFNLAFVTTGYCGFNAYLSPDESLRRIAEGTAPAVAAINRLPEDAIVLCVGEAQVFDARRPVYYNTVFDASLFEEWFAAGEKGDHKRTDLKPTGEVREILRKRGITHILVNWQELLRYRTTYGYTDFVGPMKFEELRQRGVIDPPLVSETYREVSGLDTASRQELETWGGALISRRSRPGDGKQVDVFPAFEIFPVRP